MKNKIIILVLTILALGTAASAIPSPAYACSCAYPTTAEGALGGSDIVFLGKVMSITVTTPTPSGDYEPIEKEVLFEAITVWKGERKTQYVVRTGMGGGDCGVNFIVGETAVVFAKRYDDQALGTGSCTYWRPTNVPPDAVALGQGTPIGDEQGSFPSYIVSVATVLASTLLVVLVALVLKSRRKSVL